MNSQQRVYMLRLRHPFGISRGVSTESPTTLFRLGDIGMGEAPPVKYKGQMPDMFLPVLAELAADVTEDNLEEHEELEKRARAKHPKLTGALMAFDLALWDARGRRDGKPVHELLGTPRPTTLSTYTISLAENATMEERAREAAHLPFLKIKLGRDFDTDLDAMQRIRRAAPRATLRIDANAGWDLDTARRIIPRLEDLGVEFIEQPLAIGDIEGNRRLVEEMDLPIIVDEDAQDLASLEPLRGSVSGINIKLSKCGGITEAARMIRFAREEGWIVMIGCMIESRLGLGGASHLAGLVDYMDADAHMLTTNDPFPPGSLADLAPDLPIGDGPGLGLPLIDLDTLETP